MPRMRAPASKRNFSMIKRELVEEVASRTSMIKSEVQGVIDTTLEIIIEKLMDGEPVIIRGFGKFTVTHARPKSGYDFMAGRTISVPEAFRPALRFYKDVKDDVNCANMNRKLKE